jgi:outer membrane protein assembly factor BamB
MTTLTPQASTHWMALTSCCAVVVGSMLCAPAQAQTWNYKSYKKPMGGQYNKDNFVVGTISVEEKDGKAYFRMNSGVTDACVRGAIPASVSKTETDTTIEVLQSLAGCELFRYVIRNDGTGGVREFKRGDAWVTSTWDHDLTLKR